MTKKFTDEEKRRCERIKAQQKEILEACDHLFAMERLCPYCSYRLMTIFQGEHGYTKVKCPNCGEWICFSPVKFRISH